MGKTEKLLDRILRGTSDSNISFRDICWLLRKLGFNERVRGDHHIFSHDEIVEVVNLQPRGSRAKSYQVRQVREILTRYGLAGQDDIDVVPNDSSAEAGEHTADSPEDGSNGNNSPAI